MVIIARLAGGVLCFFSAMTGWLLIGLPAFTAIALYFAVALGTGLLPFGICAMRTLLSGGLHAANAGR